MDKCIFILLLFIVCAPCSITCTAGVGTFIIEFGALSRLTGDPIYEEVAMNAIHSLRKYMSNIGLYGNHIDVQTGRWTGEQFFDIFLSSNSIVQLILIVPSLFLLLFH